MSNGLKARKKSANQLATARFDRQSAAQGDADSPAQATTQFRLSAILQVPVGYEDETGFHCGQPQVQEILPDSPTENIFTNPYPI
jgi:hypothetical protein